MIDAAWHQQLQLWQLGAIGAGLFVLLLAETMFPSRPGRSAHDRLVHFARNGGVWVLTSVIISMLLGGLLIGLSLAFESNRVGLLYFTTVPLWAKVAVGFVALDLADYVFHRMSHEVRWLWFLHAVHHSDFDVDVTTNLRVHPLHAILTAFSKLVVLAAFGIPLWIWMLRELMAVPIVQLQHSAVRVPARIERWFGYLIVTPAMHRVHHSPIVGDTNSNFGGMVPWWDKLFGTYRSPDRAESHDFGLSALHDVRWQTVWGMCATPFRARRIETL